MTDIRPLAILAKRARTIMDREQRRGWTDKSVQQTRRMALSVNAAWRATGALQRAISDNRREDASMRGIRACLCGGQDTRCACVTGR